MDNNTPVNVNKFSMFEKVCLGILIVIVIGILNELYTASTSLTALNKQIAIEHNIK